MRTAIHALAIIAAVLSAQSALGQAPPRRVLPQNITTLAVGEPDQPKLQRFDLNFPGGGPEALVAAIEKATGKPLNAIVPSEERNVQLPPMKMTNVTVPELFEALKMASTKLEMLPGQNFLVSYGFETRGRGEDAVWSFHSEKPRPLDVCRFYQLAEYLDNFTIEDITTAIQTGWELLGVKPTPRLKFHPETKLLIAVGQPQELQTIEDVLSQLRKALPNTVMRATPLPGRPRPIPAPTPKKDGGSNN